MCKRLPDKHFMQTLELLKEQHKILFIKTKPSPKAGTALLLRHIQSIQLLHGYFDSFHSFGSSNSEQVKTICYAQLFNPFN